MQLGRWDWCPHCQWGHQSCCLLLAHPLNGGHVAKSGSGNTSNTSIQVCVCVCVSVYMCLRITTCQSMKSQKLSCLRTIICSSCMCSIEPGTWYTKYTKKKVGEVILGAWAAPGLGKSPGTIASSSPMRQLKDGWRNPRSSLLKA